LGSLFPMVLMNHISELYIYNSTPFFSILAGIGLGAALECLQARRYVASALGGGILLLFASHVAAVRDKALLMQENGERATMLLDRLAPYFDQVPQNGALLLVNPRSSHAEYTVYLMNGFNMLQFGEADIKKLHAREDIDLAIIDESGITRDRQRPDALILGLDADGLKLIEKPKGM